MAAPPKVFGGAEVRTRYLFQRAGAGQRRHIVLRAATAGYADRADDLAPHDQRIAAAGSDDVVERGEIREVLSLCEQAFEYERGAAIACRGARLVLRDLDRGVLAIVHLFE